MRLKTLAFVFVFYILFCCVHSQTMLQDLIGKITNLKTINNNDVEDARKKKKHGGKYTLPLLFGALLIKSIIFPLAFKTMAVMTGISVLMSTLSLIITSIVGYAKVAAKTEKSSVKVVHKHPYSSWSKDDSNALKNVYAPMESYDLIAPPPQ